MLVPKHNYRYKKKPVCELVDLQTFVSHYTESSVASNLFAQCEEHVTESQNLREQLVNVQGEKQFIEVCA